jgi:hypothetical protein
VFVCGAVTALAAVLMAPSAGAGDNGNGHKSLDPPGVDIPGWEAEKVSGEAVGCHSEIEADVTIIPILNGAEATEGSQSATAALEQVGLTLPENTPGYLPKLLDALDEEIGLSAAEVNAAQDEDGEESLFHEEAGPVPTVKLPWQGGGPVEEEEDDCTLSLLGFIHIPLATDLHVESEGLIGPAGYAHTESESHDNLGLIYGDNEKISTECLATLEDIDAKTDIDGGQYLDIFNTGGGGIGASVEDFPEHPDENEELVDFEFHYTPQTPPDPVIDIEYSLTANEQDESDKHVTVTGLHSELTIHLLLDGPGPTLAEIDISIEGIRDQSHCDIHPIQTGHVTPADVVVVEPKFTG